MITKSVSIVKIYKCTVELLDKVVKIDGRVY